MEGVRCACLVAQSCLCRSPYTVWTHSWRRRCKYIDASPVGTCGGGRLKILFEACRGCLLAKLDMKACPWFQVHVIAVTVSISQPEQVT